MAKRQSRMLALGTAAPDWPCLVDESQQVAGADTQRRLQYQVAAGSGAGLGVRVVANCADQRA